MFSLLGIAGRFQYLLFVLLAVAIPLLLNGCNDDKTSQIDWQLPLAVPNDPHGASANQMLPQWAELAVGSAELVLLQKDTARLFAVKLESGLEVDFQDMHFRLLGLANGLRMKSGSYIEDKNVHNPAAFVEISREGRQIYRGWLYQEFPELFGPDMENWKLWLRGLAINQNDMQQGGEVSETITGTRP
jgi:hypothetical protein